MLINRHCVRGREDKIIGELDKAGHSSFPRVAIDPEDLREALCVEIRSVAVFKHDLRFAYASHAYECQADRILLGGRVDWPEISIDIGEDVITTEELVNLPIP